MAADTQSIYGVSDLNRNTRPNNVGGAEYETGSFGLKEGAPTQNLMQEGAKSQWLYF